MDYSQPKLACRNLTPREYADASAARPLQSSRKQSHGGERTTERDGSSQEPVKTADALAAQFGVSSSTIRRDGKYAEAVEKIAKLSGGDDKARLLERLSGWTEQEVIDLADKDAATVKEKLEARLPDAAQGSAASTGHGQLRSHHRH